MKQRFLSYTNALLALILALIGFQSCNRTSKNAVKEEDAMKIIPRGSEMRLMYGGPPAAYQSQPAVMKEK